MDSARIGDLADRKNEDAGGEPHYWFDEESLLSTSSDESGDSDETKEVKKRRHGRTRSTILRAPSINAAMAASIPRTRFASRKKDLKLNNTRR